MRFRTSIRKPKRIAVGGLLIESSVLALARILHPSIVDAAEAGGYALLLRWVLIS